MLTAAHTSTITKFHQIRNAKIQQPKRNSSHALSTTICLTPIHKRQPTPTHPKPSQPIIQIVLILHYSPHPIQYEKTTQTIFITQERSTTPPFHNEKKATFQNPSKPFQKGETPKRGHPLALISPPKAKSQAYPSLERAQEGGGIILNSPRKEVFPSEKKLTARSEKHRAQQKRKTKKIRHAKSPRFLHSFR